MAMRINSANVLSISRVILGLITAAILLGSNADKRFLIAMTLIVLAVITDSIDGRIARRFGFESEVGKLSDRYADHIFANIVWVVVVVGILRAVPVITESWRNILFILKENE